MERAHAVLLDIPCRLRIQLKNPEPFVLFANFGAAALELEVRVFLADITNGNTVQNDIRFAILDAFDREHIEIPSTARFIPPPPEGKWPADDDKIEAEHVEQRSAEKARSDEAESARKGRRKKKPDPD